MAPYPVRRIGGVGNGAPRMGSFGKDRGSVGEVAWVADGAAGLPMGGTAAALGALAPCAPAARAESPRVRKLVRWALVASALLCGADFLYKTIGDISAIERERCILYRSLPPTAFLAFEYLFETIVLVLLGCFGAVLAGRLLLRWPRCFPSNPLSAWVVGSLLPLCACSTVPLLFQMRARSRFAAAISFVLAAPILSPYILVLSFTVLGFRYGVLRILSSFVLVLFTAGVLGIVRSRGPRLEGTFARPGCHRSCAGGDPDIYLETWRIFRRLLPCLVVAGILGLLLEQADLRSFLRGGAWGDGFLALSAWALVGVPLYFCNGAEVLFLRPLMNHGLPLGTGIAFSLTATSVCATSTAMILRALGTRMTALLLACVTAVSLGLGMLINAVL
ncbi:MAG: hypothetical protein EHM19_05390 [Candidatus Latescibacterota bacterium]|nr:MAG: hypothetical protein EHM19_05390 [Candidatus Latescibacterota bacterium]